MLNRAVLVTIIVLSLACASGSVPSHNPIKAAESHVNARDVLVHVIDGEITDVRFPGGDTYSQREIIDIWVDVYNPTPEDLHFLALVEIYDPLTGSSDPPIYDSHTVGADKDTWVSGLTSASMGPFTWIIPSDAPIGTYHVLAILRKYPWEPELDHRGLDWCPPEETFNVIVRANIRPIASNLVISPSSPSTTDDLVGSYAYYDADGDPQSGSEIRWYRNGILQSAYNDTLTIPSTATSESEEWCFTARPKDGKVFGDLKTSPSVTIERAIEPSVYSLTVQVTGRGAISGAFVELEKTDDWLSPSYYTGVTDKDGYSVFSDLHEGWYNVQASAPGYRSTWDEFPMGYDVILGKNKTIQIRLTPRMLVSCGQSGEKDRFAVNESVYVSACGLIMLPSSAPDYPIYVVNDVNWSDGMAIPPRLPGTETEIYQDPYGYVGRTLVWDKPLTPGRYDIIVDINENGVYNAGCDLLDDNSIAITAGFLVIPEYYLGTILGLAAFFMALGVFRLSRWKKPIFSIKRVRARLK